MRSGQDGRLYLAALLVVLAGACGKRNTPAADTAAAAVAVAPAPAPGAPAVAVTTEVAPGVLMTVEGGPGTGVVLADGQGRAMYILDAAPTDTNTWKPVSGNTRMTSTDPKVNGSMIGTTTANGAPQATYNGKPLYYYNGDSAANDRKGAGVKASGATGHLVTPAGSAAGGTGTRK